MDALIKEIVLKSADYFEYEVASVFLGGGTPSILDGEDIRRIMDALNTHFALSDNCETTIEINPGTITVGDGKIENYKTAGINRLSIGLQSAIDSELRALGRIHTLEDFEKLWSMVHEKGFMNCNVDIMSAVHTQTPDSYRKTLEYVCNLKDKPTHISAYSLIVEENTPYANMDLILPSEEEERTMYSLTKEVLASYGYHRYEISNYALDGYECFHNKVYWKRGNYVGLGLGASSMVENIRWKNTSQFSDYINGKFERYENEILSVEAQMEEYMFLGLRMSCGVSINEFEKEFGRKFPEDYYGTVNKYKDMGLMMIYNNDRIMLTDEGINVSNIIFADFLID